MDEIKKSIKTLKNFGGSLNEKSEFKDSSNDIKIYNLKAMKNGKSFWHIPYLVIKIFLEIYIIQF